ncbi:uncharacterized protein LOC130644881 [Hydractinia symbiolongicarpus]|uniref:uncharacterized protein LOC130644881 n=1 Tax=Hydractinia symbiolongicarpus TaxID=13093 RepID=UPI002550FF2F|nr:uncharacterized protein LOC130644881 [Hydractinia symbiolongicarpus]
MPTGGNMLPLRRPFWFGSDGVNFTHFDLNTEADDNANDVSDVDFHHTKQSGREITEVDPEHHDNFDDTLSYSEIEAKKSNTLRKMFSSSEIKELQAKCAKIIRFRPITEYRVLESLEGCELLGKYSFAQLRTRHTYERKQ